MLLLKSWWDLLSVPSWQCHTRGWGGSCREMLTVGQTLWICSLEYWCLELPSVPCVVFIYIINP